jgi:hypothetical protein
LALTSFTSSSNHVSRALCSKRCRNLNTLLVSGTE